MTPIILDTTIIPSSSPSTTTTTRTRSRRMKQVSTIETMFDVKDIDGSYSSSLEHKNDDDHQVLKPKNKSTKTTTTTMNDDDGTTIRLKDMALRLRRAKRSLLLSAVSNTDRPNVSPTTESLRTIIMTQLSLSSSCDFNMSSSLSSSFTVMDENDNNNNGYTINGVDVSRE